MSSQSISPTYTMVAGASRSTPLSAEVAVDTTRKEVGDYFGTQIQVFVNFFNNRHVDGENPVSDPTFDQLNTAYNNLLQLYQGGMLIDGKIYHMNIRMARAFDEIDKYFDSAAWFKSSPGNLTTGLTWKQERVRGWLDMAHVGLGDALNRAVGAASSYLSIQAAIEFGFVLQGNDRLENKMSNLQGDLTDIQSAIKALTTVQNIYNKIEPVYPDAYEQPASPENDPQLFYRSYQQYGNNQFNDPIPVRANISDADRQNYAQSITDLRRIANALEQRSGIGVGVPGYQDSLQSQLRSLADSMESQTPESFIRDNMGLNVDDPNRTLAGNNGILVQQAQTAAQSINDKQKEEVRLALYDYEQFTKAASSMLQALTQLITKLAAAFRA